MINPLANIKPTAAQTVIIHTAEAAGLSILSSVLIGVVQYVSTNGLNWPGLGATCGTIFFGAMLMTYKSFQSNPNLAPALLDTMKDIQDGVQNLQQQQPVPAPALTAPTTVVIHTASPSPTVQTAGAVDMATVASTEPIASDGMATPALLTPQNVAAPLATTDAYKAPEQVPFPAQLANSFAFSIPAGVATKEDTVPRAALGK